MDGREAHYGGERYAGRAGSVSGGKDGADDPRMAADGGEEAVVEDSVYGGRGGSDAAWRSEDSFDDRIGRERYVNPGLERWKKGRAEWRSAKRRAPKRRATPVQIVELLEALNSTRRAVALPHPVSLPQAIDILNDIWDADDLRRV
eukprot:PLAT3951.1.p1 GENE.PLAT3951.1~~PLAT3951.1.p1  ORF type:complete len:154 (-),score=5.45 PLAT3951.1:36-473(-)